MTRDLITFNIQSYSDIITNSSSELFVFQSPQLKEVISSLDRLAKGWREEYTEPMFFKDMDARSQDEYIDWVADIPYYYDWDGTLEEFNEYVTKIIHRDTLVPEDEIPSLFENWNQPEIHQIGKDREYIYYNLRFSDKGREVYSNKFKYDICMWSLDENPNWERQEHIMDWCHGKRYHLG